MQFLLNKKKSVQDIFMSPKVGRIVLTPYEAIEVNVEQWDSKAFETVRTRPTLLALVEKVPNKYVELRKVYLETVASSQDNTNKIESIKRDVEILETELSAEKEDIATKEEELKAKEDTLELDRKALEEDPDDIEIQARVNTLSEEISVFKTALESQKAEYDTALDLLKDKKQELEALEK